MYRTMLWLAPAALLLVSHVDGADDRNSVSQLIAGYRNWKPTKTTPTFVPDSTMVACRAADQVRSVREARHIVVHVNPPARDAWDRKDATLPDGTIIVKQERLKPDDDRNVELGIMIKHAKSWEYSYVDGAGKFAAGDRLLHCARCHARSQNDSVFSRGPAPNATPNAPRFSE